MIQEVLHFFGRAICHQLEERSLLASGETLSVCARDTGIYIGVISTLAYLHLFKRRKKMTIPTIKTSLFLLLFMVPMAVDGFGSYAHLFRSTNLRRLVSGTSFGFVLPYFVYPLLSAAALQNKSEPVVTCRKDVLLPMLLGSILSVLVYWGLLPYFVIDSLIIFTIIMWFCLLSSFIFSWIQTSSIGLKWALSIISGIVFLSLFSLLHGYAFSYL
ncbi:DUF2085 domain-containing protein [Neobacillus sp. OS1-2]|uniref:DUF2085 domain-containing protein n=1 Tax=Neobacillus sp. OS1-2 TaxID=3070680 RepID=UPI0027E16EC7|nr:DUF2085 domain-containing protein [Neobacillus sp. OS1-2]WML41107.1 DUF2085 domain-containing protein [Neobacillus sp. OS1-2]